MGVVVLLAPDTGRRAVSAAKRMVVLVYPPCISRHIVASPGRVVTSLYFLSRRKNAESYLGSVQCSVQVLAYPSTYRLPATVRDANDDAYAYAYSKP